MADFDYSIVKDPAHFADGCLPPHSDHIAMAPDDDLSSGITSRRLSLNGLWKFHYSENYVSAPKGFEKPDFDVSGWKEIPVPSNMQFYGYDRPAYVNTQYPWDGSEDVKPGQIPEKFNPVGQYVRFFRIPEEWEGEKIHISFQGVESGFAFFLNGKYVGYSEDSFTPAEFDITPYLTGGSNRAAVLVFKWTSGSWCEDQDMYRLSGIFRDVYLEMIPSVHIGDLRVRADLDHDFRDGQLDVSLKLTGDVGDSSVEWSLEQIGVVSCLEDLGESGPAILSGSACGESMVTIHETLKDVLVWSAEQPNLYRLNLLLKKGEHAEETISELVGFRHFEMKKGLMCLNGKRIVFNGVNRHEFSCDTGRTPVVSEVIHDLTVMKQNNINAVRTCHYPDASIIYRLCDIFGIYMIAENNMETHGVWDSIARGILPIEKALPGDQAEWEPLLIRRVRSMYELEKNHTAILIWSCGNESFGGSVICHMSQEFRRLDDTRLVHYEGIHNDRRYPETSDMESQMYTPVKKVEEFLKEHPEKPFILCEYSHAMGNSNGGLFKYTDLARREPRYQGGFIWDFIDQAVRMKNRYGEEFLGYGGDNLERPTDYEFSGNGIVDAHRSPYSGKMQEVRHCYQGIEIRFESSRKVSITNHNLFLSTSVYNCKAVSRSQNGLTDTEKLLTDVAPGESKEYELHLDLPEAGDQVIDLVFTLREDTIWGKAGDEVAFGEAVFEDQNLLPHGLEDKPLDFCADGSAAVLNGILIAPISVRPEMEVIRGAVNTGVRGEHFSALFSNLKGGLVSYKYGGKERIMQIPRPNFWRAPTNNDEGNMMAARYGVWKLASLYQTFQKPSENPYGGGAEENHTPNVRQTEDFVDVTFKKYFPVPSYENCSWVETTYRIFPDGTIRFILTFDPDTMAEGTKLPPMPEFGWLFALDADLCHVSYYGMGPEENYCDRNTGSRLGLYERDVKDMAEPYLVPQETGNRTGVRYASIMDDQGCGICFSAAGFEDCKDSYASHPGTMEFSALPYSPEMMETARHAYELPKQQYTWVRCSLKQMGVGGDDSWGARTHEEFLLPVDRKLSFAVDFKGI